MKLELEAQEVMALANMLSQTNVRLDQAQPALALRAKLLTALQIEEKRQKAEQQAGSKENKEEKK